MEGAGKMFIILTNISFTFYCMVYSCLLYSCIASLATC